MNFKDNLLNYKGRSYYILGVASHTEIADLEVLIAHELFGKRKIVAIPVNFLKSVVDIPMEDGKYPNFPTERAYRHWKGMLYYVKHVVVMVHTGEALVHYQALYGEHKSYVRPFEMFTEEVPVDRKLENVTNQKYRFESFEGIHLYD